MPLLQCFVFWANGFFWLAMDALPSASEFKIQKMTTLSRSFTRNPEWEALAVDIVWNYIKGHALWIVTFPYVMIQLFTVQHSDVLPSSSEMLVHILVAICYNEVQNYYVHRLFHTRAFYRFHKEHHKYTAPIALLGEYASPVEILHQIMCMFLGIFLVGAHTYTAMVWIVFATIANQSHHSGRDWPWCRHDIQPYHHDSHHEFHNCNFGATPFFDKIHGTYKPSGSACKKEQ